MLNVVTLSVINKPFMLSVFMLNIVMLNVDMLSVFMLNVVAPVHMALHYNPRQKEARKSHYDIVLIDKK